jgi:hypothetical protein
MIIKNWFLKLFRKLFPKPKSYQEKSLGEKLALSGMVNKHKSRHKKRRKWK